MRIVSRWVPLAGLATAMCGLTYLAAQQMWRQAANDPQIQLARDAGAALERGATVEAVLPSAQVDIAQSLAPFLMVLDESGKIVASSGRLHGALRSVPTGVLDQVRSSGEERVTWQPDAGVRIASVVVRTSGSHPGFVVAGRSLRESEDRTAQFGGFVRLAWIVMLAGVFVLVGLSESLLGGQPSRRAGPAAVC